jgi:hypothetical protein
MKCDITDVEIAEYIDHNTSVIVNKEKTHIGEIITTISSTCICNKK